MKRVLILSVLALSLVACRGTADLGAGKTGKKFTVSNRNYEQVWAASEAAMKEATGTQSLEVEKNLTISKTDKGRGVIEASSGHSLLSWGEVVGVFITPTYDAPSYTIEVESRTKLATNVFSNNWEDEIIARIQQKLAAMPVATPVYAPAAVVQPVPAQGYAPIMPSAVPFGAAAPVPAYNSPVPAATAAPAAQPNPASKPYWR
jgi:hypothetical protein